MAICPVCKMPVDEKKTEYKSEHAGTTYYFHSREEKRAFDQNPHDYGGRTGLMGIR
ncbi:MAG TPA: YHS domain-containing protein [Actinobacteria bacterium]|nr:YHS domain-containing protein [Actinomycetota bacterium]